MRYTQSSAVTPALIFNVSTYLYECVYGCAVFCSCKPTIFVQCHSKLLSPFRAVFQIFWSVTRSFVAVIDNHSAILSRSVFVRLDLVVQYSATGCCLSPQRMPRNDIGIFNYIRFNQGFRCCLLYTSPSPRDLSTSRMPSSA